MMNFGAPTMVQMADIEDGAKLCRELGLQFLELNTNFPHSILSKMNPQELDRIAKEYGIFYTLHLDDELSIADFNPYVAEAGCKTVLDAIDLSREVGILKINMHLSQGAKYTLPDRKIHFFEAYQEDYFQRIREFRDACAAKIGSSGITICVENTSGFREFQRRAVEILLESPVFGLTFDIGHNYTSGNMDEDWILSHKDRLHHFHIHDASGSKNDHRALGTGELDIRRYLALAESLGCTAVIETKTLESLRQSIDWIRQP